ncbi:hypothetical protein [Vreelandella subglaciescola]|jgi:hypothetical protein|uniref:Uncharacterized protein n=1 Tax=Vreelandella subglaciescola TaxID=29571 RepID=A0A1M7HVI8_9GAMM|nr:hypothetical protein [Halomonas subglaciescola]SHM32516.1 hypothetical protein SAMN05878437_2375 [Halomonas subglaciescola]
MTKIKKIAAISISAMSVSYASITFASMSYENTLGQSSQLTHLAKEKKTASVLENDTVFSKSAFNNAGNISNKKIESYRDSNTLGQSDAITKSQPYTSLNQEYQDTPKTHIAMAPATFHQVTESPSRPADW